MTYRIREVNGADEDVAETIVSLHDLVSPQFPKLKDSDFDGLWWFVSDEHGPVGFLGSIPSTLYANVLYFKRVGILPMHRGCGLQLRLMRVLEARARRDGWAKIISDTTQNVHSANNFIRAGYLMFSPQQPWAFPETIYWTKELA